MKPDHCGYSIGGERNRGRGGGNRLMWSHSGIGVFGGREVGVAIEFVFPKAPQ